MAEAGARRGDGVSEADFYAQLPGDVSDESQVRLSYSQVESGCLEDNPTGLADLVIESSVVLGGEDAQEGGEVADSSLSAGLGGDGSLESRQPGPVVEGVALRLPSTYGRQQRPLMPAVFSYPVTGVGHDGHGGSQVFPGGYGEGYSLGDGDRGLSAGIASVGVGRFNASTVGPDRRSDIRHHYVPSVIPDDGEEYNDDNRWKTMKMADRESGKWLGMLTEMAGSHGVPGDVLSTCHSVSPLPYSVLATGSSPSALLYVVVSVNYDGEGGVVREEGRASSAAEEALRPQPANGLR
ncbi:hypothetical protein Dimus_010684 [Dionaea muscipula]